jgi:copper chaperone CopZ
VISIQDLAPAALPALREALFAVPGVSGVQFSLERSVATVDFDPAQAKVEDLLRAVLKAGYKLF